MVTISVRRGSPLAAIGTVELFDNGLIGANCLERSVRGVSRSQAQGPGTHFGFTYVGIQLGRLGKRSTIDLVVK